MNLKIGRLSSPKAIGEEWLTKADIQIRLGNWHRKKEIFAPDNPGDIRAVVNVLNEEALHGAIDRVANQTISFKFDNLPLRFRNGICWNEWVK